MKIPESIRISGVEYQILDDQPSLNDGQYMFLGNINFDENIIRISDCAKGHQRKCITLLHEVLHGIIHHPPPLSFSWAKFV